jgi:uncharacterized protein (TIGR03067 family)
VRLGRTLLCGRRYVDTPTERRAPPTPRGRRGARPAGDLQLLERFVTDTITFDGKKWISHTRKVDGGGENGIAVDAEKNPPRLTAQLKTGKIHCVYEVKGDTLRLCHYAVGAGAGAEAAWPDGFDLDKLDAKTRPTCARSSGSIPRGSPGRNRFPPRGGRGTEPGAPRGTARSTPGDRSIRGDKLRRTLRGHRRSLLQRFTFPIPGAAGDSASESRLSQLPSVGRARQ